jgi:hypothetical protein
VFVSFVVEADVWLRCFALCLSGEWWKLMHGCGAGTQKAVSVMDKRWFAGHQISALPYEQSRFEAGDYSAAST